jgi:ribonucleoside-diphosphate reductase alpha chain
MKDRAAYQAAAGASQQVESSGASLKPGSVEAEKPRAKRAAASAPGLTFPRFFTEAGVDPFDEIEWELRAAIIGTERGEVVFEQRDVEIPKAWSQQAANIVVSKYFRGQIGTPEREHSVRQLIGRVVNTITEWARRNRYFATEDDVQAFSDDLKHILVYQKAAFNSPVWFNCGFEKAPQCSACFINSVQDTMDSILTLSPAAARRRVRCRS